MSEHYLYTNRLINEKSPYLLQHAHNPVDWYPWGAEAFITAKELDKPIFLSIGYATCHWCHNMEKESFENLEIAEQLNEVFINIKVDREELPEVDALYMEFAQSMMSGSAGWPLNVILTPNLEPFFAATYLPPQTNHGLMGLRELIERVHDVWHGEEREKIMQQASKIVEVFAENIHSRGDELPSKAQVKETAELIFKLADPIYGGLKGIPKFPIGYQYSFLAKYAATWQDSRALFLVERTLDMMQRGGIYDHLSGGFSRYSVDEKWLIPHFEKMLYDNALLAQAYTETWQLTKKPLFKEISSQVLDYVLGEMTSEQGGFYSAEDADSEGKEGFFYTWYYDDILRILGRENAQAFIDYYGISEEGNFDGKNVLNIKLRIEEFAQKHKIDPQHLKVTLETQRKILLNERNKRIHPFKDDKILSSWNGLMLNAFAEAGAAFQEPKYTKIAVQTADFIKNKLWGNGKLLRRWRDGEGLYNAGLDEYAFMIRSLITLFEIGAGSEWLFWAMEMADILQKQFKVEGGAFFQTDGQDPNIILRKCHYADGAEPSGNAIHTDNLLRLYHLTDDENYLNQAEDVLKAVKRYIDNYAPGYGYHVMNVNRYHDQHSPNIVVALNHKREHFSTLQTVIFQHFIPHRTVSWLKEEDIQLKERIPSIAAYMPKEGKTTLYVCYQGVCQSPISDLNEMISAIQKL
ncbi:putative protein YyaL [Chlamydiales bacterium STE3]|nr:putative protein YyaL [Chlamydiales bacterium STE3]